MENDWPLKSHCGSVTQNKKKERERERERERENDTHTPLRQWCNGDSTDSWFISHIFIFLSLLSASYCFLFFSLILFIA